MADSWRERIVAARSRGRFTREDVADAFSVTRCAVGELEEEGALTFRESCRFYLNHGGSGLAADFPVAILHDDVDRAEALLDQIEDQALRIKRARP